MNDDKWNKLVFHRLNLDSSCFKIIEWRLKDFLGPFVYFCLVEYFNINNNVCEKCELTTYFPKQKYTWPNAMSNKDIISTQHFKRLRRKMDVYAKKHEVDINEMKVPIEDLLICILEISKNKDNDIYVGNKILIYKQDSKDSIEIEADLLDV